MCTYSMIGDYGRKRFEPYVCPPTAPQPYQPWEIQPYTAPSTGSGTITIGIPRSEFDALKREMEEIKELLKAAKRIDELTNQPDCENDEKLAVLRAVAKALDVNLDDI